MNALIQSTFSALSNRQRLLLVLGFVLVSGIVIFNSLAASVDAIGWNSGFTHPLHGGDHFLTMLAVGIWAAQLRGKAIWLLPVTFVSVMSLGGLAGAAGVFIPSAELIILLSCLVFSIFIARKIRFSNKTSVIIVAFFAFFHGFAHGQEISTSASLISYTLGFMVATLLLHSAGILIVKLCVVVFALFISHLAYAQASYSQFSVQSGAYITQADTNHELFMAGYPAPPDGYDGQLLYSSGGVDQHTEWAEIKSPPDSADGHPQLNLSYEIQKSVLGFPVVRAISHVTYHIISRWFSADWLDHQHLGILFLTSGVGETSPPVAIIYHSTPRCSFAAVFCSIADLGKPNHETIPHFDLSNLLILATSLLTNGVGATSPPSVLLAVLFVVASYFRLTLASFIALTISRLFLFNRFSMIQTQRKSRAPPFVFPVYSISNTRFTILKL